MALAVLCTVALVTLTSTASDGPGGPILTTPPPSPRGAEVRPPPPAPTGGPWRVTPQVGLMLGRLRAAIPSLGAEVAYAPRSGRMTGFGLGVFGSHFFLPDPSAYEVLSKLKIPTERREVANAELRWAAGLTARWRPIRGVFAWDEATLARFGVDLGVGVGLGETRVTCDNQRPLDPNRGFTPNARGDTVCNPDFADDPPEPGGRGPTYYEPNTLRPLGVLEGGLDVDLLAHLAVRVAVRDLMFVARTYRPSDRPTLQDEVLHRVSLVIGVSVVL